MTFVQSSDSIREAKIFLASRIAEEAEREGNPLSEIERKMLYYSATSWTLSDMEEVKAEFDRAGGQREFEDRVVRLVRRLRARLRAGYPQEYETWNRSIQQLSERDHYVMTLIVRAKPQGEILRLVITALVVIVVLLLALYLAKANY
jgi:hypothetical protein